MNAPNWLGHFRHARLHPAQRHAVATTVLLAVLLAGVQSLWPNAQSALSYQRQAILAGEWWRLLSGAFVHLSWTHLLLNVGGLLLVLCMFAPILPIRRLIAQLMVSAGATSCLLLLFQQVDWMVGLSGALHALFAWSAGQLGATPDRDPTGPWWRGPRIAWVLMLGLLTKLVLEYATAQPGDSAWLGGAVLLPAHWAGAGFGLCAGLLAQACRSQPR